MIVSNYDRVREGRRNVCAAFLELIACLLLELVPHALLRANSGSHSQNLMEEATMMLESCWYEPGLLSVLCSPKHLGSIEGAHLPMQEVMSTSGLNLVSYQNSLHA